MTPSIDIAGWTLVHFVWQGALIAALATAALRLARASAPQARYAVTCAALGAMLAAPLATATLLSSRRASPGAAASPVSAPATADSVRAEPASGSRAIPALRDGARSAVLTTVPTDAASPIDAWLPIIVTVWCGGVLVLLARLGGGWLRVRRWQRAALDDVPSHWEHACSRIATLLGMQRVVRVVDSAVVDTPTVIGWVRPVILLPIGALANLSPAQMDAILAHELAHIRRHDFLVNGLQTLAETLLFYHPGVWWVSRRMRAEREHCCDLVAVEVCGDPLGYAEALTELETWRTADVSLAVAVTGGSLLERVRRLLGAPVEESGRPFGAAGVAAIAVLLLITVGAAHYLRAAQPAPDVATVSSPAETVDSVAWRMVFNHPTSELNIIGYTGRDLIRFAHQIPRARVVGGPGWIDDETFRLVVNLQEPPAAEEMPSVVRRVLEDRFQLRTHVETRELPVYALVQASAGRAPGPNLRVSTADCFDLQAWIAAGQPPREIRRDAQRQPVCGEQAWDSNISRTSYVAITMAEFAAGMRGRERYAVADGDWPDRSRDVVDRTGLTGRYDVDIHAFLPAAALMGRFPLFKVLFEPLGVPSMERALDQQLGLRLVEATAPYDVIVIDGAQRPSK